MRQKFYPGCSRTKILGSNFIKQRFFTRRFKLRIGATILAQYSAPKTWVSLQEKLSPGLCS